MENKVKMKEIEVHHMKAKIELTRIDNRLVHGQVGMTWEVLRILMPSS